MKVAVRCTGHIHALLVLVVVMTIWSSRRGDSSPHGLSCTLHTHAIHSPQCHSRRHFRWHSARGPLVPVMWAARALGCLSLGPSLCFCLYLPSV